MLFAALRVVNTFCYVHHTPKITVEQLRVLLNTIRLIFLPQASDLGIRKCTGLSMEITNCPHEADGHCAAAQKCNVCMTTPCRCNAGQGSMLIKDLLDGLMKCRRAFRDANRSNK